MSDSAVHVRRVSGSRVRCTQVLNPPPRAPGAPRLAKAQELPAKTAAIPTSTLRTTSTSTSTLPANTIERNRAAGYRAVLKVGDPARAGASALALLAAVSFLATPAGMALALLAINAAVGFVGEEDVRARPIGAGLQLWTLLSGWSVLAFIPFARVYDRWYATRPGLRCQPTKTHDTQGLFARSEARLAVLNLILAAGLSTAVVVTHILYGWDRIYLDVAERGYAYLLASTVAYFLLIDCWAYVGHRCLHIPILYRAVHKWHHAYRQPTAFSALGLHPIDMLVVTGGAYAGFYLLPMHPACIAANLLYVHYFNVVDHSGVYSESWLPWQPSSLYHDDHHRLFHVNYGQTLTIFDRLGGTFYSSRKKYGESAFSF